MRITMLVLVIVLLVSSAFAGGWKWKSKGATSGPRIALASDHAGTDGWTWVEE